MNYLNRWILLCLSMFLTIVVVSASQEPAKNTLDEDISRVARGWQDSSSVWGKRGWQDSSSVWGKRSWNNLQGNWGKRGWERLKPTWGKRAVVVEEPEPEEAWDGVDKRFDQFNNMKGAWGKRNVGNVGWGNMRGLWGKRNGGGKINYDEDSVGDFN